MAGYPSNLAKKYFPTEQFPKHILPLLPLYNAQWWGYESLTAIVLVIIMWILKQLKLNVVLCDYLIPMWRIKSVFSV